MSCCGKGKLSASGLTALVFPAAAFGASVAAWHWPQPFIESKGAIVPLLGLIMLSMGLTLTFDDFRQVAKRPKAISAGVFLQYLFMPLCAFIVSRALGLPAGLSAGMVLVGACPGGTASNVVCYLAGGDVAMSIALTASSTLLSVAATPVLTWLYAGQSVPVPVWNMVVSIFKIVFLPVSAGVLLNTLASRWIGPIKGLLPALSILAISFIIGIVMALNRHNIETMSALTAAAVILHNLSGLAAGYGITRLAGWDERTCKTIAIEVGMQNSGLAVALAVKYFSAAAAIPGALFSLWHNLSGSLLAAYWSWRDE